MMKETIPDLNSRNIAKWDFTSQQARFHYLQGNCK